MVAREIAKAKITRQADKSVDAFVLEMRIAMGPRRKRNDSFSRLND
jgi:hypothetical protein